MSRSGKRSAALLLAVCLLLGLLAGCGKKENTQQLSATVYVPKYLELDVDLDYVRGGCSDGENVYLIGQKEKQLERTDPDTGESYVYDWQYTYDIYRVPLDGGAAERLSDYVGPSVPEGKQGSASIEDITAVGDGTFWVRENTYIWGDLDEKYPGTMDAGFAVDDVASAVISVEPREAEAGAEAEAEEAVEEDVDETEGAAADWDIAVDDPIVEEPGYYEDQETIVRRHLDAQGNELECIDISNLQETLADVLGDEDYINSTAFDAAGNLYAVTSGKIYVLDPQMDLLFTVEGEDMWSNLIPLGDGTMGMQKWDYDETSETSTNKLLTIDPEQQDWGPEYLLPNSVYNFYPGGGEYLCYYRVNDAIYGWKGSSGSGSGADGGMIEGERLFAWLEADINSSNVQDFFFLPDGRVAAITQEWSEDGKGGTIVSVVVLTATPRDQLPEKTTLTYGTLYLSYSARRRILDFNKKSDSYRIEVRDYSESDTSNDGSAALQKLNTEILAGTVPDILDTSSLPLRQYGAKGILEDLWPYIDKDPDLGRDALMLRPLEANQQDGKLYEIFQTFSISTVIGPAKIVGDRTSWTLADLQEALGKMPEGCAIFGQGDTKDGMLSTVVSMNMDQFVDWDTGKCSFDSDDFKALLSFCNTFPAEFSWENVGDSWEDDPTRIVNGKQLLYSYNFSSFDWEIQWISGIFNNDYSFIGYPKENGGCGSAFNTGSGVAMSSACKDKDGAWSFIRQTLLPQVKEDAEYYGSFPVNRADFDKMVEQAIKPRYETDENGDPLLDENGEPVLVDMGTMWIADGLEVPYRTATQEDIDKVMELYNAIDSVSRYDEKIYSSIQEVAGQYFAGDKPLDDAASLIQNKVGLYVNESR